MEILAMDAATEAMDIRDAGSMDTALSWSPTKRQAKKCPTNDVEPTFTWDAVKRRNTHGKKAIDKTGNPPNSPAADTRQATSIVLNH